MGKTGAVLISVFLPALFAAAQAPDPPSFDAVTIRALPAGAHGGPMRLDPTHLSVGGENLAGLIMNAWAIPADELSGGPDWVFEGLYTVEASTTTPRPRPVMLAALQEVLKDRFKLQLSRTLQMSDVLALVIGPNGPKLASVAPGTAAATPKGAQMTMTRVSDLVLFLNSLRTIGLVDRPVVDATGLAGDYDIRFTIGDPTRSDGNITLDPNDPISITALLEKQLGLRLEPRRSELAAYTIVHAEKPMPEQ